MKTQTTNADLHPDPNNYTLPRVTEPDTRDIMFRYQVVYPEWTSREITLDMKKSGIIVEKPNTPWTMCREARIKRYNELWDKGV